MSRADYLKKIEEENKKRSLERAAATADLPASPPLEAVDKNSENAETNVVENTDAQRHSDTSSNVVENTKTNISDDIKTNVFENIDAIVVDNTSTNVDRDMTTNDGSVMTTSVVENTTANVSDNISTIASDDMYGDEYTDYGGDGPEAEVQMVMGVPVVKRDPNNKKKFQHTSLVMSKKIHKKFKSFSTDKEIPMVDIMESSVQLYMELLVMKEVRSQIRRGRTVNDIVIEAIKLLELKDKQ